MWYYFDLMYDPPLTEWDIAPNDVMPYAQQLKDYLLSWYEEE